MSYRFITEDNHTLEHIPSGMMFQILINPKDEVDYDAWNDIYQEFEFKGNKIVSLLLNPDDFQPEPEPVGWGKIHAINRKAFKKFRSQVWIHEKVYEAGPMEDERYFLDILSIGKEKRKKIVWFLKDKENNLSISWENKKFLKTQNIVLPDGINPHLISSVLRKAGEWLTLNHQDKI